MGELPNHNADLILVMNRKKGRGRERRKEEGKQERREEELNETPGPRTLGMESCPLPVRQDARNPAGGAQSAPRCWGACPGLGFLGTAVSSASSQPRAQQKGRGTPRACRRGAGDTT